MAGTALASPPLDADPALQLDFLELVAFLDRRGAARLDVIDNAEDIEEPEHQADDGEADTVKDDRRAAIEAEFNERADALGDAYPFEMSDDGEELTLKKGRSSRGAVFYFSCLIFSHFVGSRILMEPPTGNDAASARKRQFQLIATLAVAGYAEGGAISFGWPRASKAGILAELGRFAALAGTGKPRQTPSPEADRRPKDGGMDVIAWKQSIDRRPPPAVLVYGQAASGNDWKGKSAGQYIAKFQRTFFEHEPDVEPTAVTVIPHRLTSDDRRRASRSHGHLLDRLRTPSYAMRGWTLGSLGFPVDGIGSVYALKLWLAKYRKSVRA